MPAVPAQAQAGLLDPSFGNDGRVTLRVGIARNNSAEAVAVQPDDRVVVAGFAKGIYSGSGRWFALARFLADGTLDPSFGEDGRVEAAFDNEAEAYALALQPDGRVVAAGWTTEDADATRAFALARFNPDGAPDPAFGDDGLVVTPFAAGARAEARGLALQPDGRIVAAGWVVVGAGLTSVLVRYLPDGSLDASFGDEGRVVVSEARLRDVAIQADGRIVAAGSGAGITVVRYLPDGTPDASFGTDGRVSFNFGASLAEGYGLALQPDGRIVVAGYVSFSGGRDFTLVRLDPDGALDASFGDGGRVSTAFVGSSFAYAVTVLPDGRLLAVGEEGFNGDAVMARYRPDGALDPTFGGDGRHSEFGFGDLWDVTLRADGRAVVVGVDACVPRNACSFAAALLEPDGSLDPAFGGGIAKTKGFGSDDTPAEAVAVQPDGRVLVAGCGTTPTGKGFLVARFEADGAPDATFGPGGIVVTEASGGACARALAVQPDGHVLAAGWGPNVLRYLPDGTLDPAFGTGGIATTFSGFQAYDIELMADGRIVVGGCMSIDARFAVVRLLPDGSHDTTFGSGGLARTSGTCVYAVALYPDGRVAAVGAAPQSEFGEWTDLRLARFLPDGRLDPSFGTDGVTTTNTGFMDHFPAVGVGPDGALTVAGYIGLNTPSFTVMRYTADGTRDLTFGGSGSVHPFAGYSYAHDLGVLPDGRVVVAGLGGVGFALVRLYPDGTFDPAFGDGGIVTTPFGRWSEAHALAMAADGRMVAAGWGVSPNENGYEVAVARYLGDTAIPVEPGSPPLALGLTVYPNPAQGRARVTLTLPGAAPVRLALYDVLGRQVAVLSDAELAAGQHEVAFDTAGLAAGVYVLRLTSENEIAAQRLTIRR